MKEYQTCVITRVNTDTYTTPIVADEFSSLEELANYLKTLISFRITVNGKRLSTSEEIEADKKRQRIIASSEETFLTEKKAKDLEQFNLIKKTWGFK